MATGILRIQAFAARQSSPVEGVTVNITGDGFTAVRTTDAEGNAADVVITAPDCALSLEAENTTRCPYAVCSLTVAKTGFRPVRIQGIQIFAGQVTLAPPHRQEVLVFAFYSGTGRAALTLRAAVTSGTCAPHGRRCRPECRRRGTRPHPARRPAGRRT